MSDSITAPSALAGGAAALQRAIYDSGTISRRLDTLTRQAGDGLVSDTFGGLGGAASVPLRLGPVLAHQQAWQNAIDAGTATAQVSQDALQQISAIASNFYAQTNNLNGVDPSEVDTIAASARDALKQVAGLLDTQDGGVYVFAGQDSANPPVPSPDDITSSGFYTQIAAAVGALGTNGAAATSAATLAIAQSNAAGTSPFSAALSQPAASLAGQRPTVPVGGGVVVPIGVVASANADVASTGTSTTGSYTRDILRALATIGSLGGGQVDAAGFSDLVQDTHASLGDAITALNGDAGVLGNRQTELADTKDTLGSMSTALTTQLSNVTDVDTAQTLTALTQTQTQLQSSYQIIAALQGLSLTKYLGAG